MPCHGEQKTHNRLSIIFSSTSHVKAEGGNRSGDSLPFMDDVYLFRANITIRLRTALTLVDGKGVEMDEGLNDSIRIPKLLRKCPTLATLLIPFLSKREASRV